MAQTKLKIFSLNANIPLAEKIAATLGVPLAKASIKHFADGEIQIDLDESVRGAEVYVVQPTADPVNENLMELLVMVDALRRASAERINVVMPYYGYARADRKARSREPITAKLVANLIEMAGVYRVIALDLHADQIQGFFDIPVDHLRAMPLIADYFEKQGLTENTVVVSPDHSSVKLARGLAELLGLPIAIVDSRPQNELSIIGDVTGKNAIVFDDMIDTAERVETSVAALKANGVKDIYAAATHAVFSKGAVTRLKELPLAKVIVTDSINLPPEKQWPGLVRISVGEILGQAIELIHNNQSTNGLF